MRSRKFQEQQRFTRPWVLLLVALPIVLIAILLGYGVYQQLVLDQPFGFQPGSDTELVFGAILSIAVALLLVIGLSLTRLVTSVTNDGLLIEFRPFRHRRLITWRQIVSCKAREYRPIREYGGWGMRRGRRSGHAYNVYGSHGVQLELIDGEQLLIGSQEANRLSRAIQVRMEDP